MWACRNYPNLAKPITKAIYLLQKHLLNQFNLICEFALFLYHTEIVRALTPLQKQQHCLLMKRLTGRLGETGAISLPACTWERGTSPCCLQDEPFPLNSTLRRCRARRLSRQR